MAAVLVTAAAISTCSRREENQVRARAEPRVDPPPMSMLRNTRACREEAGKVKDAAPVARTTVMDTVRPTNKTLLNHILLLNKYDEKLFSIDIYPVIW